ncbi:hypothetical protein D0A37_09335 [Microcoleus vaginatus HSN003]|nr:hypothetical protein D0A37_09335 [Microcoleus vaginatus HSN003]
MSPGNYQNSASTLTFGIGQNFTQYLKLTHSNLQIRRNLEPQQFGNSCQVNFRSQNCREFTQENHEIGAKSIGIESKIRTKILQASRKNNRCSSGQAIENII